MNRWCSDGFDTCALHCADFDQYFYFLYSIQMKMISLFSRDKLQIEMCFPVEHVENQFFHRSFVFRKFFVSRDAMIIRLFSVNIFEKFKTM